jgi:hypothetical protein
MQTPCPRRTRFTVAVGALILAEATVLLPRAVLRGESLFERDLLVDWYQRLELLARCLREGSWPLWDPTVGFGYPLLAEPGAQVLYPPAWAAFALPSWLGYTVFVLAHLVLGGVGMARLASAAGAGRLGGAAAACVWAATGPVQSALNLRHHFAGAAWVPWVLLAVDRALRAPSAGTALAAAAVVSAQALAGSPDVSIMTALLAGGWASFRLLQRPRRLRAGVPVLLISAVLAAGLTAAQWWPALDVLSRSSRRVLPEDVRAFWSVPPAGLVRLVLPLDPARVPFEPRVWTRLFDAAEAPLLASIYLGAPALLLAATGLLAGTKRGRSAAAASAVLSLLVLACALGSHTPVYRWATTLLPVLRILRYPSKGLLVAAPLVALAAGVGVDAVARGRLSRAAARFASALAVALALALTAVGARLGATGGWAAGPVLLALAALVLLGAALGRLRHRLAAIVLAALCALDLTAAHLDLTATTRLDVLLQPPPAVAAVDSSEHRRVYVYDYHSVRDTSERYLGRRDPYLAAAAPPGVGQREFAVFARTLFMPAGLSGLFGLENSYDFDLRGLYSRDLNDLTFFFRQVEGSPVHAKLLRMGAVGTVLSLHRAGLEDLRLERVLPSLFPEPILVWRVPAPLPRAWLVGCARVADRGDAFRALLDAEFDPAREVILPEGGAAPAACGPAGLGRVASLRPDRVRVEVDAQRRGYLVLADAWDPGWATTLDGRPVPLLRGNVAFRAVAVPPGQHVVEMAYRPPAVARGASVSLASGLLALVAGAYARRRRASRPPRSGPAEGGG